MLEFQDTPQKLIFALDKFLSNYYGDRQVIFKPNLQEISNRKIPQTLKYYYSFVEKYPGKYGTLNTQDGLILNSGAGIIEGKLLIVNEYTGCWCCVTEIEGEDPPVWLEDADLGDGKLGWKLVCNSLSRFLVTFSLQEALISSKYIYSFNGLNYKIKLKDLLSAFKQDNWKVTLLWKGKYVSNKEALNYFYAIEDAILIWSDGWCGTNYKNADILLKSILSKLSKI